MAVAAVCCFCLLFLTYAFGQNEAKFGLPRSRGGAPHRPNHFIHPGHHHHHHQWQRNGRDEAKVSAQNGEFLSLSCIMIAPWSPRRRIDEA